MGSSTSERAQASSTSLASFRAMREALSLPAEGEPTPGSWRSLAIGGKLMLLMCTGLLSLVLTILVVRALFVLSNPL